MKKLDLFCALSLTFPCLLYYMIWCICTSSSRALLVLCLLWGELLKVVFTASAKALVL